MDDVEARSARPLAPRAAGAGRPLLLLAAVAYTLVWLLPLALAVFSILQPAAVYEASPAQARTAWSDLDPADRDYVRGLITVLGGVVGVIALLGIVLTWSPLRRGKSWAAVLTVLATALVVALATWLHLQGFWQVYPVWAPAAAWLVGAVATAIGLGFGARGAGRHGSRPVA